MVEESWGRDAVIDSHVATLMCMHCLVLARTPSNGTAIRRPPRCSKVHKFVGKTMQNPNQGHEGLQGLCSRSSVSHLAQASLTLSMWDSLSCQRRGKLTPLINVLYNPTSVPFHIPRAETLIYLRAQVGIIYIPGVR